ncbi:MAG: hypothetical protein QOG06_2136 [Gaiellaceae bacterium]|nr:hypothetical protein [Gaiellaceae bacterium]MDX6507492.1 hypothetical protein [Gaiellaceae bacterium]
MRIEILFLLMLSAVTLFAVVRLERQVADTSPSSLHSLPRGFVWGGRTFVDLQSFAHWLRSHGHDYQAWAQNHRHRAGLAPIHSQRRQESAKAIRPSRRPAWVAWIVAAGGFGFVVCVVALRRRWHRVPLAAPRRKSPSINLRVDILAMARSEIVGLGRALAAAAETARAVGTRDRGGLFPSHVDWRAQLKRLLHRSRSLRRRAARPSRDFLWYSAATLLAAAMGLAVALWG